MSGGAYSALSGMQTRLADLDRLASDLANVGTPGYKTERDAKFAAERDRFDAALESAVDVAPAGSRIDFRAGTIATTGRDLDVAIKGSGFFVVETPNGPRYTRNGSFNLQADGTLATSDGYPVLGDGGPITLGKGAVSIDEDGTIRTGATVAGRLQIVRFEDEQILERDSGARFRATDEAAATPDEDARVVAGALEQSNVSVVDRMVALTEIKRGFEALQKGVSVLFNDIDMRAITELGRRG
jgi:flagellar basal-body rod protein FlgF